jgi:hypothetical protein
MTGAILLPFFGRVTCPHCAGLRPASCHRCHGGGVLRDVWALEHAVGAVWARPGCACDACRKVGPGPRRST